MSSSILCPVCLLPLPFNTVHDTEADCRAAGWAPLEQAVAQKVETLEHLPEGSALAALRVRAHLSQAEVARRMGLTRGRVAQIENQIHVKPDLAAAFRQAAS